MQACDAVLCSDPSIHYQHAAMHHYIHTWSSLKGQSPMLILIYPVVDSKNKNKKL